MREIITTYISEIYRGHIELNSKETNYIFILKKWAKDLNRHFSKKDKPTANRYMER